MRLAAALVLLLLAAPAAAGKPRAPTKLRVTAIDLTSVRVTWHNRSRAARPQLAWRRVGSAKRRAKKVRRRRGATTFLHRGLQPGARYVYRVRACRRGRCSRWSRRRRGGPLAPGMGAPAPGPPAGGGPTVGSCPIFPPGNPWNRDVSADPVDPRSAAYVASIGAGLNLHPDFGSNPAYGLPYIVVPASQPRLPVVFSEADESDPGPYPIPANAPVEAGSDRHVLALQEAPQGKGAQVTREVLAVQDNGIEVRLADTDITTFIKRSDLSRDRSEQRPERYHVGDKVDAAVTNLDKNSRRVSVSIKALEIAEEKEAVAQYGSTDSGASLGDILGAALKNRGGN